MEDDQGYEYVKDFQDFISIAADVAIIVMFLWLGLAMFGGVTLKIVDDGKLHLMRITRSSEF